MNYSGYMLWKMEVDCDITTGAWLSYYIFAESSAVSWTITVKVR